MTAALQCAGLALASCLVFQADAQTTSPGVSPASAAAPKTRAEVKAELKASRPKGTLPSPADMDRTGDPLPTPRPRASASAQPSRRR